MWQGNRIYKIQSLKIERNRQNALSICNIGNKEINDLNKNDNLYIVINHLESNEDDDDEINDNNNKEDEQLDEIDEEINEDEENKEKLILKKINTLNYLRIWITYLIIINIINYLKEILNLEGLIFFFL